MKNFPTYESFIKKYISFDEYSLNEKMGVPSAIGPYAAIMSKLLVELISDIVKDEEEGVAILLGAPTIERELNSKDLSSAISKGFPLNKIHLAISIIPSMNTHGMPFYLEGSSGEFIKNDNGYECNINVRLTVHVLMIAGDQIKGAALKDIQKQIEGTLYHELDHEYEEYMRAISTSKIKLPIIGTEARIYDIVSSSILKAHKDLPPPIGILLSLIYLNASYEINARVAQVYSFIKDVKDPRDREKIIKNTRQWEEAQMLLNFDAKLLYDQMISMAEGNTDEEKAETISNFIKGLANEFVDGSKEVEKTLNTEMDLDSADKRTLKGIIINHGKNISKLANKPPLEFLKFWENQFHSNGEKLKRKILKLSTY